MLIVGDESKHSGVPRVTFGLVGVNLIVFLFQLTFGEKFTRGYSLVPYEITTGKDLTTAEKMKVTQSYRNPYPGRDYGKTRQRELYVDVPQAPGPKPIQLTLLSSMFMHGGWIHLLGNMWFLIIFGRNVELAMRHGLFLVFFLTCGVASGFVDILIDTQSVIPYLGASGAISGVMGAYFFIYPLNNVKCWFGWWIGVIELPSFIVVGGWLVIQYLSTVAAITTGAVHSGVAYWSHLGGFVIGIAFILITLAVLKYQQQRVAAAPDEADEEEALASQGERATTTAPAATPEAVAAQAAPIDPFKNFLPR